MNEKVKAFNEYPSQMNERILAEDNRIIKRMFSVDSLAYSSPRRPVPRNARTARASGLARASLRRLREVPPRRKASRAGVSRSQIVEAMSIGLVVGGTIVIPHLRRAMEFLDALGTTGANPPP